MGGFYYFNFVSQEVRRTWWLINLITLFHVLIDRQSWSRTDDLRHSSIRCTVFVRLDIFSIYFDSISYILLEP